MSFQFLSSKLNLYRTTDKYISFSNNEFFQGFFGLVEISFQIAMLLRRSLFLQSLLQLLVLLQILFLLQMILLKKFWSLELRLLGQRFQIQVQTLRSISLCMCIQNILMPIIGQQIAFVSSVRQSLFHYHNQNQHRQNHVHFLNKEKLKPCS